MERDSIIAITHKVNVPVMRNIQMRAVDLTSGIIKHGERSVRASCLRYQCNK